MSDSYDPISPINYLVGTAAGMDLRYDLASQCVGIVERGGLSLRVVSDLREIVEALGDGAPIDEVIITRLELVALMIPYAGVWRGRRWTPSGDHILGEMV